MIRKFQDADLHEVAKIWLDTNVQAHNFIPPQYWERNFELVKGMLPQAELYIYEQEGSGRIQGFIGLKDNYVAGIFVCGQAQANGIGKQLLNFVKKKRAELSLSVYQKNAGAVKFYQREGFEIQCEGMDGDTGEKEYTMAWRR